MHWEEAEALLAVIESAANLEVSFEAWLNHKGVSTQRSAELRRIRSAIIDQIASACDGDAAQERLSSLMVTYTLQLQEAGSQT